MRIDPVRLAACAAVLACVLAVPAGAGDTSVEEKEYDDATVLLVDHAAGLLGVGWSPEEGSQEQKLSFLVDLERLDVTNPFNHDLTFEHVTPGDHVDLFTRIGEDGTEKVVTIYEYSKLAAEA